LTLRLRVRPLDMEAIPTAEPKTAALSATAAGLQRSSFRA